MRMSSTVLALCVALGSFHAGTANAYGVHLSTSTGDGFKLPQLEGVPHSIPVEATYLRDLENGASRDVRGVLHAVRRVPGATVVYASVAFSNYEKEQYRQEADWRDLFGESSRSFRTVSLLDPSSGQYWFPYRVDTDSECLCPAASVSPVFRRDINSSENGRSGDGLWTYAIAFPELPPGLNEVDVAISGDGRFITDVPVGEGALEPMAHPSPSVIKESFRYFQKIDVSGWPYIPDSSFFKSATWPSKGVRVDGDTEVPLKGTVLSYTENQAAGIEQKSSDITSEYKMAADIAFEFDSAELTATAQKVLEDIRSDIGTNFSEVRVAGHTDDQGEPSYNMTLSQKRADVVAQYLQKSLPAEHFLVEGFGETQPLESNSTELGRKANRRVVVTVTK